MPLIGEALDALDTPVLWADLDALENNIAHLAQHFRTAGIDWRPHVKGIKIPAIAQMAVDAGAIGVTCAKISEAEVMVNGGLRSVLVANQLVTAAKIRRLAALQRRSEVLATVDAPEVVRHTGRIGREMGVAIPLLVDLNTGMNRTGVTPGAEAVALARLVAETPGVRLRGLMAYEGHAIEIQEPQAKADEIRRAVGELVRTAAMCRAAGLPVAIVSGGGSGTYKTMPFQKGVTEIQAGGAAFSDEAYPTWGVETKPALFVRATVTSRPTPHRVTFDAGWKALPTWAALPRPLGIDRIASVTASAEHGIVTLAEPNAGIRIGQAFDFVVGYNDSTVFLHDALIGIRQGRIEVQWTIQGRGKLT